MITAFEAGGDFHSRTALGMYPYIRERVEAGEVLLERDEGGAASDLPLLKDVYASERRKAKVCLVEKPTKPISNVQKFTPKKHTHTTHTHHQVLNFSIAYGKTARGLAKDWNVSIDEAKETLDRWYADRPEVSISTAPPPEPRTSMTLLRVWPCRTGAGVARASP